MQSEHTPLIFALFIFVAAFALSFFAYHQTAWHSDVCRKGHVSVSVVIPESVLYGAIIQHNNTLRFRIKSETVLRYVRDKCKAWNIVSNTTEYAPFEDGLLDYGENFADTRVLINFFGAFDIVYAYHNHLVEINDLL